MLYCRFPLATYFTHDSVNMSNPDDLGGWDWGKEGRSQREGIYVYISLIHFIAQQKVTQHCKAIALHFIYLFIFLDFGFFFLIFNFLLVEG